MGGTSSSANAAAAPDIERSECVDAGGAKHCDQLEEPPQPLPIGSSVEQLAAEMHCDGVEPEQPVARRLAGQREDLVEWHPELDPAAPGRNVGMGIRSDVRIDPDPDRHRPPAPLGDPGEGRQLGRGLEVHVADAGRDRRLQLGVGLSHPAEHDPLGSEAGLQSPRELPARHDIRTGAEVAKCPEHAEVCVGLDRKADPMRQAGQRLVEDVVALAHDREIVDVRGRSDPLGNVAQPHAANHQ